MNLNIRIEELIYPVFVISGKNHKEEISSMPGIFKASSDVLLEEMKELSSKGLKNFLIFGVPDRKDELGTEAYEDQNLVSDLIRQIKMQNEDITIYTDVCLCAYTSHGHCGVIKKEKKEFIDNKATLELLGKMAVSHAKAGADYVAPSAMADGQVKAIRMALDENGFEATKIMGYSAKFASSAYGPFRNIAESAPKFGDRKSYQLDYVAKERAIEKIAQDIEEGADVVMVKPALWYLDIVREASSKFDMPLAVYNVSGEYAMVKQGAQSGLWEEEAMVTEILTSMKRSGADLVITYHAKDVLRWMS